MMNELLEKINQIWISSEKEKTALAAYRALSQDGREKLDKIKEIIRARVSARNILNSSSAYKAKGSTLPQTNSSKQLDIDETSNVLLLLTMGVYHSDSFIYLPSDMREERLRDWASITCLNIDIVREVVILGPEGINSLLVNEMLNEEREVF